MQTEKVKDLILAHVESKGYKPKPMSKLADAIGVAEEEMGDFHDACKALLKKGRIVMGARNAVMLPEPSGKMVGTFRLNPKGFGFVIPDTANAHGDLFIPPGKSNGALTGDTVRAKVRKKGKRGGSMMREGEIVEIVQRGSGQYVGELKFSSDKWYVVPDGKALNVPVIINDPGAKNAKEGDQVVIEITEYPEDIPVAQGVITKVIGKLGEPGIDTQSIIEQYQLPGEFPEEVLKHTRKVVDAYDPDKEKKKREDLTDKIIITIDPDDARDFDDAISLELEDGNMILGVHIADVAHFVKKETVLDDEAYERGTSIYLPSMVIPMLPEVLSNGVCSLQEDQIRLTKTAFITYDKNANIVNERVCNSIIKSKKRLTYVQASAILESPELEKNKEVRELVLRMNDLAKRIQLRRQNKGMLELEMPDYELTFDDYGNVSGVVEEDTSYSHKIIEMFMVEANEVVARFMYNKNIPAIRRTHDLPSPASLESLNKFLKVLGYVIPKEPDIFDLQNLIVEVLHSGDEDAARDAFAVQVAILRSMQQAEYSPSLIGHFALASEHYTHFTSPIRRYPDLTIHRLIDDIVHERYDTETADDIDDLRRLGNHCSERERRAESAERELKQVLVLRLLETKIGEKFAGVVTGVSNAGVFVELDGYQIDGVLPFKNLTEDWWEVDTKYGCVVGERSGQRITIGDRFDVIVASVDVPNRLMELGLSDNLENKTLRRRKRKLKSGAAPKNAKSLRGGKKTSKRTGKKKTMNRESKRNRRGKKRR